MPINSRAKGRRGEQEVVNLFKRAGWNAVRKGHAQSSRYLNTEEPDVYVTGLGKVEVKRKKNAFPLVNRCLANNDALVLKDDFKEWVICIPLETFLKLNEAANAA